MKDTLFFKSMFHFDTGSQTKKKNNKKKRVVWNINSWKKSLHGVKKHIETVTWKSLPVKKYRFHCDIKAVLSTLAIKKKPPKINIKHQR